MLWRDFFKFYAVHHGRRMFLRRGTGGGGGSGSGGSDAGAQPGWSRDMRLVRAWINGATGHPFIDANMRELQLTGFMSNRGRQNVASFFTKWQRDISDAQGAEGQMPSVAPHIEGVGADGGPAWADAAAICPWTMYLCYGDKELLAEHFESLTKFIGYMETKARNLIRSHPDTDVWHGYGDWLALAAPLGRGDADGARLSDGAGDGDGAGEFVAAAPMA